MRKHNACQTKKEQLDQVAEKTLKALKKKPPEKRYCIQSGEWLNTIPAKETGIHN